MASAQPHEFLEAGSGTGGVRPVAPHNTRRNAAQIRPESYFLRINIGQADHSGTDRTRDARLGLLWDFMKGSLQA